MRSKYFIGLDSRGIRALKDKAPSKEKVRIPDWNAFVELEATEAKMVQKEKNKANRSLKIDVHCLGRKSYAEKNEEMKSKDPHGRSPERADLYIEARKQAKTGELHPNVVEGIKKLTELRSSQDSTSYVSLDDDALTRTFGKYQKGRTRGVGPVSKGKIKAITPIKSEMERVVSKSTETLEKNMMQRFSEVNSNVLLLLKAFSSSGQVFSPPSYTPPIIPLQTPSPSHSTVPFQSPSPTPSSPQLVKLQDFKNKRIIAEGFIEPIDAGSIVHHRPILKFERKVNVVRIFGDDSEPLYLERQGCATTIGDVVGGYVVWPVYFIQY